MRTLPNRHPYEDTRGQHKVRCDICGAIYLREDMTVMRDGTVRCPLDSAELDPATLAELQAGEAEKIAERRGRYADYQMRGAVGGMPNYVAPIAGSPWYEMEQIPGLVEHFAPGSQVVRNGKVVSWGSAWQTDPSIAPSAEGLQYRGAQYLNTNIVPNQGSGALVVRFRADELVATYQYVVGASAGHDEEPYCLVRQHFFSNRVVGRLGTRMVLTAGSYPASSWCTGAMTWNASTVRLFAETSGVIEETAAATRTGGPPAGTAILIGGNHISGPPGQWDLMNGYIKAVAVFDSEIAVTDFETIVGLWA